ncbi:hypothetical protein ACE38W_00425 [Chitinophaga sp. Hz27]|uniref:hypothetical protein n=1 Tax=Chitinophaga sp. Hz27 TaxID=3347169 RepID=UPI0035D64363
MKQISFIVLTFFISLTTFAQTSGNFSKVTVKDSIYLAGKWIKSWPTTGINLYNSDGALTSDRTISANDKSLVFDLQSETGAYSYAGLFPSSNVIQLGTGNSSQSTGWFTLQADHTTQSVINPLNGTSITMIPNGLAFDQFTPATSWRTKFLMLTDFQNITFPEYSNSGDSVLTTDGTGRLKLIFPKKFAAGNTGELQFNDDGQLGAIAGSKYNKSTGYTGFGTQQPKYKIDVAGTIATTGDSACIVLNDRYFTQYESLGYFNRWKLIADTEKLIFFNNNSTRGAGDKYAWVLKPSNTETGLYNLGINVTDPINALDVRGAKARFRATNGNSSLLFDLDTYAGAASIQALDTSGILLRPLYLNPGGGDVVAGNQIVAKGLSLKTGNSDDRTGTASFPSGTTSVTINTTAVTANSKIFLTINIPTSSPVAGLSPAFVGTRSPGNNFTIVWNTAASGTSGTVSWMIVEPN